MATNAGKQTWALDYIGVDCLCHCATAATLLQLDTKTALQLSPDSPYINNEQSGQKKSKTLSIKLRTHVFKIGLCTSIIG